MKLHLRWQLFFAATILSIGCYTLCKCTLAGPKHFTRIDRILTRDTPDTKHVMWSFVG